MNQWGYVIACWVIVIGVLGVYAAIIIGRGRALSRQVPPEDRRWM
jgi:hypothetical protein